MYYTVYRTTNRSNGKVYVGSHSTNDLADGYLGSGRLLRRAVNKYGVETFIKEILFVFNSEAEMLSKEHEIVTPDFCARADTYNLCDGGRGGWRYVNEAGKGGHIRANMLKLPPDVAREGRRRGGKEFQRRFKEEPSFREIILQSLRRGAAKAGKRWAGKTHSEASRRKIGITNSQLLRGANNGSFGSKWMMRDGHSRRIRRVDVSRMLELGWAFGRVMPVTAGSADGRRARLLSESTPVRVGLGGP